MAQATQERWLNRLDLDYDQLSGRYLGIGALLALLRVFWVIARTSKLLGSPDDSFLKAIEQILGYGLVLYAGFGLFTALIILTNRMRQEDSVSSTRLLINVAGVFVLLAVELRISSVITAHNNPYYPFTFWGQQLTNGLILGGVYALVALGYTLVYGILFMINFAHGEVLVVGTYGGYFALLYLTDLGHGRFEDGAAILATTVIPLLVALFFLPPGTFTRRRQAEEVSSGSRQWMQRYLGLPIRLAIGALIGYGLVQALGGFAPNVYLAVITLLGLFFVLVLGMVASMLVAITVERVAYRPLRRAPRLTPLISAIGASFFLQQSLLNIFGPGQRFYERPDLIKDTVKIQIGSLGSIPLTKTGIVIVFFSIILMIMLYLFVKRTKTGRAMRSVAEDKDTAALMGVDVDHVIVVTFALGAMLAGAAGVMMGFHNLSFNFRSGFIPGLKAFTAAVLGGIGNIPGAMFGGFFLGLVEAFGPTMLGIPNEYKDVIAFSLLVLILIFRPTGLFGEVLSEKKV